MDQASIERTLIEALHELYAENSQILRLNIGEQTICSQLAGILQRKFDDHAVHTEYNRHGVEPKGIEMPDASGALTWNRVRPDIVVHQPGHDGQNMLVIEVKKSTNPAGDDGDLAKLAEIKRQINYRSAVFLRLPTGPTADEHDVRIIWV